MTKKTETLVIKKPEVINTRDIFYKSIKKNKKSKVKSDNRSK